MKKTLFLICFTMYFACNTGEVIAQEPVSIDTTSADTLKVMIEDGVPDTLTVLVDGEVVKIPTTDAVAIVDAIKQLAAENKDNWPTNVVGWITLIIGIVLSGKAGQVITSSKRLYGFLKIFVRSTLNVVALVSGALSVGITFLVNKGDFNWETFATLWGTVAFISVYIYEAFVKPKPIKT